VSELRDSARPKRRWKRFLVGAAGALVLLALIYPVWFPWVLKPVVARIGIRFADCERYGYSGFGFSDIRWDNGALGIHAEQVRLQSPHRLLWQRLTRGTAAEPQALIRDWQLRITPPESPSQDQGGGMSGLLDDFQGVAPALTDWLDWLILTNGKTRATIDLTSLAKASLGVTVSNSVASVDLGLNREGSRWAFEGGVLWSSNRFELRGSFDRAHWLPAAAVLHSDSLQVPLTLPGAEQLPDLEGDVRADWTNGIYRFSLNLSNHARSERMPERIALRARGEGDLETVRIDRLELDSEPAKATLEQPLTLDYSGRVRQGSSALQVRADLGRIDGVPLTGVLSGEFTLQPVRRWLFSSRFDLRGTNVQGFGVQTTALRVSGNLKWPTLELTSVDAKFPFGGDLSARLRFDVNERRLETLQWEVDGTASNPPPGSVRYESLHATGSASGVWPDLTHTGRVEVAGIEVGAFRAALANVNWSGRQLVLDHLAAAVQSGPSGLEYTGQAELTPGPHGTSASLRCDALELITPEGVWRLQEPARVDLLRQTDRVDVSLSPFELTGPDSLVSMQASIHWPSNGSARLTFRGLHSSQVKAFLSPELPALSVPRAELSFSWDNGPLIGELDVEAQWMPETNQVWSFTGRARADGQSLQFDSLRVDLGNVPSAELTGKLPLRIEPAKGWNVVEAGVDTESQLDLRVLQKGPLWSVLEKKTGVKVESPSLTVRVRGRPPDVDAQLLLNAARAEVVRTNADSVFVWPTAKDLRLDAVADLNGVTVRRLEARLLDQQVIAQGQWSVTATNWSDWFSAFQQPDWSRLTGRLRMPQAELSALSALAPGVIAPVGQADLDLALGAGWRVNGRLILTNAATRFLKPVGALRDIEADITLDGWSAAVQRFTGRLGGQPVTLRGDMAWRSDGDRRLDLRLQGENLSLLRNPDLFLRADLDLRLQKSFGEVARLSGEVGLRRSLLLRNFNSLVGFDRERPEQRPPYFSIPQPPFGDWQLDVRVKGNRFLNVISPAFKGEISAGLQLAGTLREPLAVGSVTVDQGRILFPFGMVKLENGRVDLTREDPYQPHLDFRGVGQNFGYSVTVDVSGLAEEPNVIFQSVPPLTTQQILLMLTAGEIPRSDFGYSSTDKATRVGLYVGGEFLNRFIGNTSASERLVFRSGQDVTDQGSPTYLLEYRVTDRWAVFGEYDRFRDLNSGLKFKVLSK